jgi:septum formation protein
MNESRPSIRSKGTGRGIEANPPPLILASASPRRRGLLDLLGIPFQVIASDDPETIDPRLTPAEQAALLATSKARAVAAGLDTGLVIGADTIVVLDGDILGKPADDMDAARMLRRLSGREHHVITGIALVNAANGSVLRRDVVSNVRVKPLSDDEIAAYVATGEPRDKAGAYGIQGLGGSLIAGFEGCYNNVVGLPLCYVSVMLAHAGVAIPPPGGFCRLPDGSLCAVSV